MFRPGYNQHPWFCAESLIWVFDSERLWRLMRTDILVPQLFIPLHRDSSFLYEVTGSNPSRAINSVHPRQARCLSILRKFRHNIRKKRAAAPLLTSNLWYWRKRFKKDCLFMNYWAFFVNKLCSLLATTKKICQRRSHGAGYRFSFMYGVVLPPCGSSASLLTRVIFEVIQIYYCDSKNWTSALLRRALSLLRPELTKIMKPTAKSCLASARTGKTVSPSPRSDFKRWLIELRWIKSLMPNAAHTDMLQHFLELFITKYYTAAEYKIAY